MASVNEMDKNCIRKDGSIAFTGSEIKWVPPSIGGNATSYGFLKAKQSNTNGWGFSIGMGSGGSTCIGSGESMDGWFASDDSGDIEDLFLCSDNRIVFKVGAQNGYTTAKTCSIDSAGNFSASKVYNAVWNDYAEYFPKGEETEPGDIIALDINSNYESYIKADSRSKRVVGVHSDTYGHLIGGDPVSDKENFINENNKKYIPVGLCGRVYVKVVGKVTVGDYIVPSDIKGVGRALDENNEKFRNIIGYVVEADKREDIRRVKIFITNK